MKTLVKGSSYRVKEDIDEILSQFGQIKKVAVFFNNENFLLTEFTPMHDTVFLILEDISGKQIHIESANCGYGGTGPHTTVDILKKTGVTENFLEELICSNQGVRFSLNDKGKIIPRTIDTTVLFTDSNSDEIKHNISMNTSINVDLMHRKVMMYNPQYNNFSGLILALSYMNLNEFEYFIGSDSPLENGYRFSLDYPHEYSRKFQTASSSTPNMSGLRHVNLVLRGEKFSISCLIDDSCVLQTINTLHCAIFRENLFRNIIDTQDKPLKCFLNFIHSFFLKNRNIHDRKRVVSHRGEAI